MASHPEWNCSLATPNEPSDGDLIRGEVATIAAPQVPAIDKTEACNAERYNGSSRGTSSWHSVALTGSTLCRQTSMSSRCLEEMNSHPAAVTSTSSSIPTSPEPVGTPSSRVNTLPASTTPSTLRP